MLWTIHSFAEFYREEQMWGYTEKSSLLNTAALKFIFVSFNIWMFLKQFPARAEIKPSHILTYW